MYALQGITKVNESHVLPKFVFISVMRICVVRKSAAFHFTMSMAL